MDQRLTSKSVARFVSGAVAVLASLGLVLAQGGKEAKGGATAGAAPGTTANRYIGADKCKNCHQAEASGNQWGILQQHGHAKAFATLASEEAMKIAKEKGIDDPQKSEKCLKCHVTAFGAPADAIKKGFDPKLGVQCESCHGPGEQHVKARFAAAAKDGGEEGFGEEKGKVAEYVKIPENEIVTHVDQKTCLTCHNEESPTFKPFCFCERAATIAHLDPRKPHEPRVCTCTSPTCTNGCKEGKCTVTAKDKK